jgi:ribosome-binding protein aMBF1 (putative translation factor)
MAKQKRTTSASKVIFNRFYKNRPDRQASLEQTAADVALGDRIHELRTRAGLSQKELADLIGTQPSAICRIEDADYQGHSVETLRRIARALKVQLKIEFIPENRGALQRA